MIHHWTRTGRKKMKQIFKTKFGSHLYGTNTPSSDVDWKGIFIPNGRDILLGTGRESFNQNDKEDDKSGTQRKNEAGEIDIEYHSLRKYLKLAAEGQTVALDILFSTPLVKSGNIEGFVTFSWDEIWKNRDKLSTSQCKSFIGYAYQQAAKYGVRGSRMAAAEAVSLFFKNQMEKRGALVKCSEAMDDWASAIGDMEHTAVVDLQQANGSAVPAFECCNRKAMATATMKEAHAIFARIFDGYGHRARQAKTNQNVDWKALSHAVRITTQAIEYLRTGHIEFPRPDAAFLLSIKNGNLPYLEVAEKIEGLLDDVRAASERSSLPEQADHEWIDDFVTDRYRKAALTA